MNDLSKKVAPIAPKIGIFSFFSGAGFLDLGFEKAGYQVEFANEIHKPFSEAYVHARNKMGIALPPNEVNNSDIESLLNSTEAPVFSSLYDSQKSKNDFLGFIGGPPCPDFSVGGKNKGSEGENGKLSETYVDLIVKHRPDFFLFENVKGLFRTKKHRAFYDRLKRRLNRSGYTLTDEVLNCIEFGVPQDRQRVILVGIQTSLYKRLKSKLSISDLDLRKYASYKSGETFALDWPETDEFFVDSQVDLPEGIVQELTVQHWFTKNDVYNHKNSNHSFVPRAGLKKFLVIDEGDVGKKSYKRLHRWRYSPTAAYGNNEVHLHPYKARRLSAAESLAIQSLPKEFELPESMSLSNMFKTIGNGVPYLMALGIANSIKSHLHVLLETTINTQNQ